MSSYAELRAALAARLKCADTDEAVRDALAAMGPCHLPNSACSPVGARGQLVDSFGEHARAEQAVRTFGPEMLRALA